jgi:hypothetical protein
MLMGFHTIEHGGHEGPSLPRAGRACVSAGHSQCYLCDRELYELLFDSCCHPGLFGAIWKEMWRVCLSSHSVEAQTLRLTAGFAFI